MGIFPSFHPVIERDLIVVYKIQHVKTLEKMYYVHNKPYLLQHATIKNINTWPNYLGRLQQLSTFPLTAAVQHIIQLAQKTCTVYTVLYGDMSQPHTIQII